MLSNVCGLNTRIEVDHAVWRILLFSAIVFLIRENYSPLIKVGVLCLTTSGHSLSVIPCILSQNDLFLPLLKVECLRCDGTLLRRPKWWVTPAGGPIALNTCIIGLVVHQ